MHFDSIYRMMISGTDNVAKRFGQSGLGSVSKTFFEASPATFVVSGVVTT